MTAWGFENGHLEAWDFGHPGWTNERFSGFITSPVKDTLTCEVLSWTPGTNGPVTAHAYQMTLPEKPAQEEFTAYLATQKDKVKGKIVLAGKQQIVPVTLTPPPRRQDDKQAKERYDPSNPNAGQFRGGPCGPQQPEDPTKLTARQIDDQIDLFLDSSCALIRVNDAACEHRQ